MRREVPILLVAAVLGAGNVAAAETYHVSIDGHDDAAGTGEQPWRTLQRAADVMVAGDTVVVHPGEYAEYPRTRAHGAPGARITFRAEPANDAAARVTVRGFRIEHRHVTVEGFDITRATGPELGHVVVYHHPDLDRDGSHCEILNNTFRDGIYLIADDFRFDAAAGTISTPSGSFLDAGFVTGGQIYLGADAVDPYENHDVTRTVAAISADGHTLTVNEPLLPEPREEVYAVIYITGRSGFPGVNIEIGSSSAATDCVVRGNTFRNLCGGAIRVRGANHLIEDNLIEEGHGWDAMRILGDDHLVRRNVIRRSPHFIHFTEEELRSIPHETSRFYDFQISLLQAYGIGDENIVFENNYIEDCYNQLGYFEEAEGSAGIVFRNNVVIGVPLHMSNSRSGLRFENNTLYRAAYEGGVALATGPHDGTLTGLRITRNAFVDVGRRSALDREGWYVVTGVTDYVADENFVAGPELLGFPAREEFTGLEASSIDGGDPLFFDVEDPDGADDVPLTDDDGLRPLPGSPLCPSAGNGLVQRGAYPCLECRDQRPFAHFVVTEPRALLGVPVQGEYRTPDVIGHAPVELRLDASGSVSCDDGGIASYRFAVDGCEAQDPTGRLHLRTPGDHVVALTVRNGAGRSATYRRTFRVLPSVPHQILRLRLDGTLQDGSGRPHRAAWEGESRYEAGDDGQAASFSPAAASAIAVAHRDDLDGMAQLTFACWAERRSEGAAGALIEKRGAYTLELTDDGRAVARVVGPGAPGGMTVSTALDRAEIGWHHYAATFDGASLRLYVDGALLAEGRAGAPGPIARERGSDLRIGGAARMVSFDGRIDDVVLDERALAQDGIERLLRHEDVPSCEGAAGCGEGERCEAGVCVSAVDCVPEEPDEPMLEEPPDAGSPPGSSPGSGPAAGGCAVAAGRTGCTVVLALLAVLLLVSPRTRGASRSARPAAGAPRAHPDESRGGRCRCAPRAGRSIAVGDRAWSRAPGARRGSRAAP